MDLISLMGYRKDSPYKTSPYLDIFTEDGLIDMSQTDQDLIGIDELGNKKKMKAGRKNPYKFEGKNIREIPMQQGGYTKQDFFKFLFDDKEEQEEEPEPEVTAPTEQDIQSEETNQDEAMKIAIGEDEDEVPTTGNPYAISSYGASMIPRTFSEGNPYKTYNEPTYVPEPEHIEKTVITGDKAKYALDFFVKKGLPKHHAAGIVGNLIQESGNFRDDVIAGTRKGDSGLATGIAQWHPDRRKGLENWAAKKGMNPYTLDAQLEYVYHEANQRGDILAMAGAKTPEEASYIFAKKYERPKFVDKKRIAYAKNIYNGSSR